MASRLFVGNLPYEATEAELSAHFSQVGPVSRVFIPLDRDTGKPRGFAFIEFDDSGHAAAAIEQLHQKPFKDRPLVVNEARPSEARSSGPASRPPAARGPATGRPPASARSFDAPGAGEGGRAPASRRFGPPKPKRRGAGKRSFWEDGPRKEPIPEKRRGQLLGGFEDDEEEDVEVDFDDFATSLPDDDQNED